jgi:putative serine protease PepD
MDPENLPGPDEVPDPGWVSPSGDVPVPAVTWSDHRWSGRSVTGWAWPAPDREPVAVLPPAVLSSTVSSQTGPDRSGPALTAAASSAPGTTRAPSWSDQAALWPTGTSRPVRDVADPGDERPEPRRGHRRLRSALLVVTLLAVAVVGGAAGAWLGDLVGDRLVDPSVTLAATDQGALQRSRDGVPVVARTVVPSVVSLRAQGPEGVVTGSGFVIQSEGYLLTNDHVVAAAAGGTVIVTFEDGSRARARIVGRDPSDDLAVLKVRRTGLPALTFADSATVAVGDPVIAVGAPLGLQGTVTTGIVSAVNRAVLSRRSADSGDQAYLNALQTDAAINPGNSGGPLVDTRGRVVGINSAIAGPVGTVAEGVSSVGLGFAIPSNQARRTAEQLIRTGRARHPAIGVRLDPGYRGEGVRVVSGAVGGEPPVRPGGPAARAGIRSGDVILAVDDRPVLAPEELIVTVRARAAGDTVRLTVRRDRRERVVEVRLDAVGE